MVIADKLKEMLVNNLQSVSLSNLQLNVFPIELYDVCESIEFIDLSGNKLTELPTDIYRFKKLKFLFLNDNQFTTFPESLYNLESIELLGFKSNKINFIAENAIPKCIKWLILTNNKIEFLPNSIGNCIKLQKCMFAGNQLKELPESMQNCKNLELLRISANQLESLPDWLFLLPKLTWLAFSGNNFNQIETEITCSEFDCNLIQFNELIGEGASGFIYKAKSEIFENKHVAIKIFKGEVTSDGYPKDEMQITLNIGEHANLVSLIGRINNHSEAKEGLIFELIPNNFSNLASPPSLKSCTRDIFDKIISISIQDCLSIINQMISVAQYLHQKGINHGDFYAHNILIDSSTKKVLFTDFGAASLYSINSEFNEYLQKIEVRALGILIDDLLQIVDNKNDKLFFELEKIKNNCLNETVHSRPLFSDLMTQISVLS